VALAPLLFAGLIGYRTLKLAGAVRRPVMRKMASDEPLAGLDSPGGLIVMSAGDRVPADALVLSTEELRADESLPTGEQRIDGDRPVAEVWTLGAKGQLPDITDHIAGDVCCPFNELTEFQAGG